MGKSLSSFYHIYSSLQGIADFQVLRFLVLFCKGGYAPGPEKAEQLPPSGKLFHWTRTPVYCFQLFTAASDARVLNAPALFGALMPAAGRQAPRHRPLKRFASRSIMLLDRPI